jgi:hypothetical protein
MEATLKTGERMEAFRITTHVYIRWRIVFLIISGPLLWHFFYGTSLLLSEDRFVTRGRLICLDRQQKEVSCAADQFRQGFKTGSGKIFLLKLDKKVITLNQEKRFQTDLFQLTLQKLEGAPDYEILKSQLVREGRVFDFYYFCPVCNITSFTRGPCMCCQGEMEYHDRETPDEGQ